MIEYEIVKSTAHENEPLRASATLRRSGGSARYARLALLPPVMFSRSASPPPSLRCKRGSFVFLFPLRFGGRRCAPRPLCFPCRYAPAPFGCHALPTTGGCARGAHRLLATMLRLAFTGGGLLWALGSLFLSLGGFRGALVRPLARLRY